MAQNLSPELIQQVSDLGVLVCIGAIVLVFIVKILDFLITQAKTVSNSITPKLNSVLTILSTIKTEIVGTVTAHNTNASNTFVKILSKLDDIERKLDRVEDINQRLVMNQEMIITQLKIRNDRKDIILDEMLRQGIVSREQLSNIINSIDNIKK